MVVVYYSISMAVDLVMICKQIFLTHFYTTTTTTIQLRIILQLKYTSNSINKNFNESLRLPEIKSAKANEGRNRKSS